MWSKCLFLSHKCLFLSHKCLFVLKILTSILCKFYNASKGMSRYIRHIATILTKCVGTHRSFWRFPYDVPRTFGWRDSGNILIYAIRQTIVPLKPTKNIVIIMHCFFSIYDIFYLIISYYPTYLFQEFITFF